MIGYIYIASNPSIEGKLLKIGKTKKIAGRQRSLSNSSLPKEYEILFYESCIYADKAEDLIFKRLDYFRENNRREFFDVPFEQAREVCMRSIEDVNENPLADLEDFDNKQISEDEMFWLESPWA